MPDESVDLIFTSPPYALHFKKEYGNVNQDEYVDWLVSYAAEFQRVLTRSGSLVLDLGGSWQPGHPVRSLCHFEVLIRLVREYGFHLAQEFYWYNPAKLPAPAEWVTVRRIRVKDSIECLWWLSKTTKPKADNRQVLVEYSEDMKRLLKRGYRAKERPAEGATGSSGIHLVDGIRLAQFFVYRGVGVEMDGETARFNCEVFSQWLDNQRAQFRAAG